MNDSYLIQGAILGFTAGILPGPVMMFMIGGVLKNGFWEGLKVQLGATTLDIVRVIIAWTLFAFIPNNSYLIAVIAIIGAMFLIYMAYQNFIFKLKSDDLQIKEGFRSHPYIQGVTGNIMNPSAYIFWLVVGGPIIAKGLATGGSHLALQFSAGFLITIFLVNLAIVSLVHSFKTILSSKYYIYIIKMLGLVLLVFAFLFFKQAFDILFA